MGGFHHRSGEQKRGERDARCQQPRQAGRGRLLFFAALLSTLGSWGVLKLILLWNLALSRAQILISHRASVVLPRQAAQAPLSTRLCNDASSDAISRTVLQLTKLLI